jgi:hypothetical protein
MTWHEAVVAPTITLEREIARKAIAILSLLLKESNKELDSNRRRPQDVRTIFILLVVHHLSLFLSLYVCVCVFLHSHSHFHSFIK